MAERRGTDRPAWWSWDLEFSARLLKRMLDRRFSEVDLRKMIESASSLREDVEPGRFVVVTSHDGRRWEVIVEPDPMDRLLIVVTAYAVDSKP